MQKICIIIPCYNEADRLDLDEFKQFLERNTVFTFCFVDDGSTDLTLNLLENFKKNNQRVEILALRENSGKAEAVRKGVLQARISGDYGYLGFWDADLATPLNEIPYFLDQVVTRSKKFGMGSRMKRMGANVSRKPLRHLLRPVFSTFSSLILGMPVYDTQCGAKIFSMDLCHLFEEKFISKWLFDVEILARFRNAYGLDSALEEILEIPVNAWIEKGDSKLKLKHILRVPMELFKIHVQYRKRKK